MADKVYVIMSGILKADIKESEKKLLDSGYDVCIPAIQDSGDMSVFDKAVARLKAMKKADEVLVGWEGPSFDCTVDLGMAIALGKKVRVLDGRIAERCIGGPSLELIYGMVDYVNECEGIESFKRDLLGVVRKLGDSAISEENLVLTPDMCGVILEGMLYLSKEEEK